jgi:hypothetical protein
MNYLIRKFENQLSMPTFQHLNTPSIELVGCEDGYCPEVFDYCKPDLVIISK